MAGESPFDARQLRRALVDALNGSIPEGDLARQILTVWDCSHEALTKIAGQPNQTKARKMEFARRALEGKYV